MPKKAEQRQIDVYFARYAELHSNAVNKAMQWIVLPLLVFSILGLVWAARFPYIGFLGRYNGYFNWASLLIGFSVYYCYRLSPVLSYAILLIIFAFAGMIVTLEKMHSLHGWPEMWHICLGIFVLALAGQFIGYKFEGKKPSFTDAVKFLLIGPLWLLHFLYKKAGIGY